MQRHSNYYYKQIYYSKNYIKNCYLVTILNNKIVRS
nr:MAG TPA: hypothetical protein [Caudoviricetes sp.]